MFIFGIHVDAIAILLCLVLFLVLGCIFTKKERLGIPPGPSFLPVVGNLLDLRGKYLRKRHRYFGLMKEKYGNIFRIYLGSKLVVILNSYDTVNEFFVKRKDVFTDRPTEQLWGIKHATQLGRGIIWSNGLEWKTIRRTSVHILRDLGVGKCTIEDKIREECNVVNNFLLESDETPINFHSLLMKATTNIICGITMGTRFDYCNSDFMNILKLIDRAFRSESTFSPMHVFPFLRFIPLLSLARSIKEQHKINGELRAFVALIIEEHKDSFEPDNIRDFIDVCLANSESSPISEGCMHRAIGDLFLAGSDTTAGTLDWAALYMILHPEIQRRCQKEIDGVVNADRQVCWSDREKLPYVEATMLEVQRHGNGVPASLPHMASEDAVVCGYLIPKGTTVYANMYACHKDPIYWTDPEQFRPERFLDENCKIKKMPSFLPFSTGPRICPGEPLAKMELFLFFTNILQKFTLRKCGNDELSIDGDCGVSMATPSYVLEARKR